MQLTKSFAFKNSFLHILVFFPVFGVFVYLMFSNSANKIIESANLELRHKSDLVDIQTKEYIEELISSLDYLTFNPVLQNFLKAETNSSYNLLADNYLSLLQANKDFDQIRYIEAGSGQEVVRVERKNEQSFIVRDDELQIKKDRPYFTESMRLNENDIFFSAIDLNKEFGKISLPRTPTLRLARPVFKDGKKKGIVLINVNLENIFSSLKTTVGDNFRLQVLNEDGYYLLHENVDSTFLFEYDIDGRVEYTKVDSNNDLTIDDEHALKHIRVIDIPAMPYALTSAVIADKDLLLASYREWRNRSIALIFITSLLLFSLTYLIMNRQSKTLEKITAALKAFPNNRKGHDELINRKDEIGDMARSFSQMADLVNSQIDSINVERIKAEKAVKEKTEFIENISHEIRNPLQSIIGLNTMLRENQPNENQLDILNSMKFNTTNLLGLVNNVLDYQNMLRGTIELQTNWLYIPKLVGEVIMGHTYSATEKGLVISSDIDPALITLEHKLDHLRLSQILGNLVSNAIKFTPKGGKVKVCCSLQCDGEMQTIRFMVEDTGLGMTKEELQSVKERYFSGLGIQSLQSSHGIGLTIVSELLQLYHSELHIDSKKGEGSSFSFDLQLEKRETVIAKNDLQVPILLNNMKVLIVEDDHQIVSLYHHWLENTPVDMQTITDVEMLAAMQDKFDLIIADFRFAKKTIADAREQLLTVKKDKTALIIASAVSQDLSGLTADFKTVQFIRKPFTNNDFISALNLAYLSFSFGLPNMDNIKNDYDHNQSKYQRAFELLFSEWEGMIERLVLTIDDNDPENFKAALHKFVTTLRRLDLGKLNEWLIDIQNELPLLDERKERVRLEVSNILTAYLSYMRSQ